MGSRCTPEALWQHQAGAAWSLLPLNSQLIPLQATTAFKALLNIHPHDPGVLRELAPLLASQGLYAEASTLFSAAFDYFRTTVPHVTSSEEISSFGTQDLETLADVLHVQRQYAQVVNVIRTGVRWLQGREKETGWDVLEDDREYDQVRKTRDGWEREARFLEEAKVYDLDVRLRTRLGAARMGEGKVQEAQVRFLVLREAESLTVCVRRGISRSFLRRTSPSSRSSLGRWRMRTSTRGCTRRRSKCTRTSRRTKRCVVPRLGDRILVLVAEPLRRRTDRTSGSRSHSAIVRWGTSRTPGTATKRVHSFLP